MEQIKTVRFWIIIIVCVAFAAVSIGVLAPHYSSPKAWPKTVEALDSYCETSGLIALTATGFSFTITLLPEDIGSSVADEIDDISGLMLLVTGMLYMEKFMLTIAGYLAFTFLFPIAAASFVLFMLTKRAVFCNFTIKMVAFSLIILLLVPVSIQLSETVERFNHDEIHETISIANQVVYELQEMVEDDPQGPPVADPDEDLNIFQKAGKWISDTASSIGETVSEAYDSVVNGTTELYDMAKDALHNLTNAFAVLIVTICVIPILTWTALAFVMKAFLGLQLPPFENMFDQWRQRKKYFRAPRPDHSKIAPSTENDIND